MTSTTPAIFQRYSDNILAGITPTATVAPSTSYSLATFLALNPAARILWGVKTVTITWTLGGSALGDILVIPMHNIDPGGAVLTLTNGAGFSHAITVPALQADNFPPTLVVDLTAFAGTRTSNVWNLVIASNSVNVAFGAAIMIYGAKRTFSSLMGGNNLSWGLVEDEEAKVLVQPNEYGTLYIQDYGTKIRSAVMTLPTYVAGVTAVRDWYRANHGPARPSLLWIDPTVTDALFGYVMPILSVRHNFNLNRPIQLTFTEKSKGLVF